MLIYRLISWLLLAAVGWVVFFFMFRSENGVDPDDDEAAPPAEPCVENGTPPAEPDDAALQGPLPPPDPDAEAADTSAARERTT
jgi:hypothetical protein